VFADIDPVTFNLDPARIEAAITPATRAIMPVHCYGTPCDVERIEAIARKHNLKVIYDAAHAFGVRKDGRSILQPWRPVGAELSRDQGIQHLRRRRHRLPRRRHEAAHRSPEEFRHRPTR
jgi:hypothetical protein